MSTGAPGDLVSAFGARPQLRGPATATPRPGAEMNAGAVAGSMRELAGRVRRQFPQMIAHQHIADAADALDRGLHDGAVRHLNAAVSGFAPLHLGRQGVWDGDGRAQAKRFMDEAHRHVLLVRDLHGAGDDGSVQFAGAEQAIELARRAVRQMAL